jgi:hypothetical protein
MVWRALSLRVWCLSLMSLSSSIGGLSSALSWPALHSPAHVVAFLTSPSPLHSTSESIFLRVPSLQYLPQYCTVPSTARLSQAAA